MTDERRMDWILWLSGFLVGFAVAVGFGWVA